jgi:hypothetical protein
MASSIKGRHRRRRFNLHVCRFIPAPNGGWMCSGACGAVRTDEEMALAQAS